jgi:hypothetical protein
LLDELAHLEGRIAFSRMGRERGVQRMSRRGLVVGVIVGCALAAGVAGFLTARSPKPLPPGHGSPLALRAGPTRPIDTSGWDSVTKARASLAAEEPALKSRLGLTPSVIATTRAIYTFPSSAGVFAGVSFFEVSRPGRGSCYFMLGDSDCWARPPAIDEPGRALPVQFSVTDLDGPFGPIPIALTGVVAPEVTRVTMTCFGRTYLLPIRGKVIAWVAPSADIGGADCELRGKLAGGGVYRVQA